MLFANFILATSTLLVGLAAQATALTLPEHAVRSEYAPEHNVTAVGAYIEARANCAKPQSCSSCVKTSGCAFSKTTFTCGPKSSAAKDQVTSNTGCPQINQMQSNGEILKTVWESADYSALDIKNKCSVAIALGDGKPEGAFVVQSPFNVPVCINHFKKGTGSCYPMLLKLRPQVSSKYFAGCDISEKSKGGVQNKSMMYQSQTFGTSHT
ncbi:hypothetical protein BOTBODRAFT_46016 [Botryobasidium botryosum FD-172 SS1]|uniref:Uncharacterized protein n=1 Tax=Botryobasidium botryosum (strain FD-172 SS1) TaxID=930990 RepID=A0A067M9A1_BOTB1|nr:hypothetical protein BOTBODRAFT_46016 [Botryobasidium botryosum FD-172 SS1]